MKIKNVSSVYEYIKRSKSIINRIKTISSNGEINGFTPPSTLIGEYGYPRVSVGLMFTTDYNASVYDAPRYWAETGYDVSKIFAIRSSLVNAKSIINVNDASNKTMENIALSVMSRNELAIDLKIEKLVISPFVSKFDMPSNITGVAKNIKITEDVKLDRPVEKVYYDHDFKSLDAINYLYGEGIYEDKISKMLSVGGLGIRRKIVPTKWSITAVDDSIGKNIIEEIKEYSTEDVFFIMSGGTLGNNFTVLFFEGPWSFELIEAWNNGNELYIGKSDYEQYSGRTKYVENTAGAYYAVRLAVLEKLKLMKRQFSVVAIREITPEYFVPLGVWVVRESARKAMNGIRTDTKDFNELIAKSDSACRYVHDISKRSKLIDFRLKTVSLNHFI